MRDLKVYRLVASFIVAISFVLSINIANTVSSFADESYEIDTDPMICAGDDIYYLQRNGFVSYWGSYAKRVFSDGRPLNKIVQIHKRYALRQDGTVWNMKSPSIGNAAQIEGVDNVRKITGNYCIKNDGNVYSDMGKGSRIGIGYIEDIIDLVCGNNHYLALRSDGTVWAWGTLGSNNHGQLGTGSAIGTSSMTPVQVSLSSDIKIKAISASGDVSMALDESGNVYTWGDNEYGQLGDGKEVDSNIPIKVPGLSGVTKIVAGPNRCFAYTNTAVYGWGCNNRRQLRYDSSIVYKSPTVIDPLLGSTSLSCGEYYTLYIKNDKVYVFGSDALEGYHRYNYELHGKRRSLGEITEAPIPFSENYYSNGTWGDYRYVTSYIYPPDTIINTRELTDFYLNTRETLTKGSKLTLTITRMPINTVDVYPEIWESSDPEVVAVNEYGTVTAIKAGTANVTATIRGITKTCIITVEEIPLEGISISPLSIINPKLKSYSTLTLNFTPENTTDSIEATWSTSDSNIATVSSTGRVYIKGPGIAEITATVGSFSALCEIKVPYPNMVSFDGNGGVEVPESQEYSYGEDMIIPEAVPVRDGYSFEGWATGKCIKDKYKPGDSYSDFIINYSSNQEKTLYAVWRANDTGEIEYAHDYEEITVSEPTCEGEGKLKYKCKLCEHEYLKDTEALGHSWDDGIVATDPTCESEGVKVFTCRRDLAHTKTEVIPPTGHSYDTGVTRDVATCSKEGVIVFTCEKCGNTYEEKTPALGHVWNLGEVTKPATCESSGEITFTCSRCNEHYSKEVPALGHDWDEGEITKIPSCGVDGEELFTCKRDHNHKKTEIVPALIHEYNLGVVIKEATCEERGEKKYTCRNCGDSYTEEIAALGHVYDNGQVIKPATCETDGVKKYTCSYCGNTYTEIIKAFGHDWGEGKVIQTVSCEDDGIITYTCKNDSSHTKKNYLKAFGHKYNTGVLTVNPTCTSSGTKTFTCLYCGNKYTEDVSALGHNWNEGGVTKYPTCEEDGVFTYKCKNDKTHTRTEAIPATGHEYTTGSVTIPATCTSDGIKVFMCINCGDTYTEKISSLGHDWNDGKITEKPTCEKEGIRTYTCKRDYSHVKTESIPVKEHVLHYVEGENATCLTDGTIPHYECEMCNNYFADEEAAKQLNPEELIASAKGHNYDTGMVTKEATETEEGLIVYKCTACGEEKNEVIPKLSHDTDSDDEETVSQHDTDPDDEETASQVEHTTEEVEASIINAETDDDLEGSTISPLMIKSIKETKKSIKIGWKQIRNADKYILYANKCGKKNKLTRVRVFNNQKNTYTVKKVLGRKLKKGTYYKFIVVAADKDDNVISYSKIIHVATKGNKKASNPKSVVVMIKNNKAGERIKTYKVVSKIKIKKKKSVKIKAIYTKVKKTKVRKHIGIRYESRNKNIATINKRGLIKGINKGTTYIYVYAQNGALKVIKVVVS